MGHMIAMRKNTILEYMIVMRKEPKDGAHDSYAESGRSPGHPTPRLWRQVDVRSSRLARRVCHAVYVLYWWAMFLAVRYHRESAENV